MADTIVLLLNLALRLQTPAPLSDKQSEAERPTFDIRVHTFCLKLFLFSPSWPYLSFSDICCFFSSSPLYELCLHVSRCRKLRECARETNRQNDKKLHREEGM